MKVKFILILFVLFSSCTRIENKVNNPTILEYFDIDTSWNYVNNKLTKCFQDTLLSYLEIRFSTHGTLLQPNRYLNLQYNRKGWRGIIGLQPIIVGDPSFRKEIIPKFGWRNFEDSLISIDINSINFIDSEKDSIDRNIMDGESLHMEIITPNQYKIYSFHVPENLIKNCRKSKSLTKFKRLYKVINDNFNEHYKKR